MTTYPANSQVTAIRQTNKTSFLYLVKIILLSILSVTAGNYFSSAQCVAPSMSFHSPVLISGTANQIGSVYRFPNVMPGVDANIKVVDLVGGAQIYNIDDSAGIGYYDAFQPYVVAPANITSYVDWEIKFKVAGSTTDTALNCFAITGVDIDGNGSSLQEFIEAATPGSYALDPFTILNFSFDGVRSKAVSLVNNIPSIDTAHREAMFQMNFKNISTLQYRNGAISTYGADMVRQTCIYFKSFFQNFTLLLPVNIISFTAQPANGTVALNWSATNENDLNHYVVQKSSNGITWKDIQSVTPGVLPANNYFITDPEKNTSAIYYRLKQIERTGQAVYSKIVKLNSGASSGSITHNTMVKDAVNMQLTALVNDMYKVEVYTISGSKIKQQQVAVYAGFNTASVNMPAVAGNGLYVLTVKNSLGELIHQSKLVKN